MKKIKILTTLSMAALLATSLYANTVIAYDKTNSVILSEDKTNSSAENKTDNNTISVNTIGNQVISANATDNPSTSNFKTSGKIWIAGDSIAADHSYENEADYAEFVHGWGEIIGNYLTDSAEVVNLAISGQTAKFFTEEDNYKQIINGIGKGDLLLVSFGHNDYKSAGDDHSTLDSSVEGSYKWYLKNYYIEPALKVGAMPVLCTSVVLCEFNEGYVKENQRQAAFAQAMRELYKEYTDKGIQIGFIDTYMLTQSTFSVYNSSATSFYALKYDKYPDENGNKTTSLDHVHFSYKGADMAAKMIAENLFVMYEDFNRYNAAAELEGKGTKEEPYLIKNSAALFQIMQDEQLNSKDKYYKLAGNIDCVIDNKNWTKEFRANLDGAGYTITNPINRSSASFIDKNFGVITNLKLKYGLHHTTEKMQYPFVKENYGEISNCSASGSIWIDLFLKNYEQWNCGIFAEINEEGGTISSCTNNVSLTVNSDIYKTVAGGITAINKGEIKNCKNTAMILNDVTDFYGSSELKSSSVLCIAGGIAGIAYDLSKITDSNSTGIIEARCELKSNSIYVKQNDVAINYADVQENLQNEDDNTNDSSNGDGIKVIKGDANLDGKTDLADAKTALKFALGITAPTPKQLHTTDLNGDNKISLDEVKVILKYTLGIIKEI